MKSVMPSSYPNRLERRGPELTTVNWQGVESWRYTYVPQESKPDEIYPDGFLANGWGFNNPNAQNSICSSAGIPGREVLCADGLTAAVNFYEYMKSVYPQCQFQRDGDISGQYETPFREISGVGYDYRRGIVAFCQNLATDPFTPRLNYTIQCPGWSQPTAKEVLVPKEVHFLCPIEYRPIVGKPPAVTDDYKCKPRLGNGTITFSKSPQFPSCPKDGNPCVPGTGAKELTHTVLTNGIPLTLHYLSAADFPATQGLGPNWRHNWGTVILNAKQVAPLRYILTNDQGYGESYALVSGNEYRNTYSPGAVLRKVSNGFELLETSGKKRQFDDQGRLTSIDNLGQPNDSFVLSYDINGRLASVGNRLGRNIEFAYSETGVLLGLTTPDQQAVTFTVSETTGNLNSVLAPGQDIARQFLYENSALPDRVTGIIDETGHRFSTYNYDAASGKVVESKHAGDVYRYQLAYPNASSTIVTNPLGLQTTYVFGSGNYRHMESATDSRGAVSQTYNGSGQIQTLTDRRGSVTEYSYDGTRQIRVVESRNLTSERITESAWNTAINRVSERRVCAANSSNTCASTAIAPNLVSKTSFNYNSRGQVVTTTHIDPANASNTRATSFTYCDVVDSTNCPLVGLRLSADGARADVADITTYTYRMDDAADQSYRKGDLWKITNALNQVTEFIAYDGAGRLLRQKDANGVITDLVYHPRGWLISRTVRANADGSPSPALDARTLLEYEPYGDIRRVIQPDDSGLEYCRDQAHRITAVVSTTLAQASRCNGPAPVAGSEAITYVLDGAGNRLKEEVRDSTGNVRRLLARQYNSLNQLRALINAPFAAQSDLDAPGVKKTSYTYDANGNQDLTTDPMARVADNDYDPLNRLIQSIQDKDTAAATGEIAATVRYEYDARDNLRKVTDPKGLVTEYVYDGLNNQTQLISPDTGSTTYTHDAAGNRLSQTDARGVVTQYAYDALGRLLSIQYPSDPAKNVQFAYDQVQPGCAADEGAAVGRLVRIDDASGTTRLCHDTRGNLRRKIQDTAGQELVVAYRYNPANRLVGMTYPSGLQLSYGRDAQGRIQTVNLSRDGYSLPLVTGMDYLPFGPAAQISFGNGQSLTKAWDQNYWPDAVGGSVLDYDFTTNEVGNITGVASASEGTQTLGYDRLDRLQEVRDQNLALIEAYTYDATGNRLSHQLGNQPATSYTYPATSHRLDAVGSAARSYDAVGNTVSGIPGYESDSASYDARNRLVQVGAPSAQLLANYNGRGERVIASQGSPAVALPTTSAGWTSAAGVRGYVYDESGQVISMLIGGNPLRYEEIVWIDNIPVGRVESSTSAVTAVHAIHSDHLNTPRALANAQTQGGQAAGTVVWRWKLNASSASGSNAFGTQAAEENPDGNSATVKFDLRFPGQQYDAATGVNYNYFRDYEAGTGRYVESDPIGLRGGLSTYGYALADPLRRVDPTGEAAVLLLPLCAGGACQAFLAQCAYAAGGLLIAAGIYNVADELQKCPNNGQAANDACYDQDEDEDEDDGCDELLNDMVFLFTTILAQMNQGTDVRMLVVQYHKQAAQACKMCPRICQDIPRFRL